MVPGLGVAHAWAADVAVVFWPSKRAPAEGGDGDVASAIPGNKRVHVRSGCRGEAP
jgi:hypothetical protein